MSFAEFSRKKTSQERVLLAVQYLQSDQRGEPATKAKIARMLSSADARKEGRYVSVRHIARVVKHLCSSGQLMKSGRGEYWLLENLAAKKKELVEYKKSQEERLKAQEQFFRRMSEQETDRYHALKHEMETIEDERYDRDAREELEHDIRMSELEEAGLTEWQVIIDVDLRDRMLRKARERYGSAQDKSYRALNEAIRLWISYVESAKDPKVRLEDEKQRDKLDEEFAKELETMFRDQSPEKT